MARWDLVKDIQKKREQAEHLHEEISQEARDLDHSIALAREKLRLVSRSAETAKEYLRALAGELEVTSNWQKELHDKNQQLQSNLPQLPSREQNYFPFSPSAYPDVSFSSLQETAIDYPPLSSSNSEKLSSQEQQPEIFDAERWNEESEKQLLEQEERYQKLQEKLEKMRQTKSPTSTQFQWTPSSPARNKRKEQQ